MSSFEITDEERSYMTRPITDSERIATKGMPPLVASGFVRRQRAQYLANKRDEKRRDAIYDAIVKLGEAIQ